MGGVAALAMATKAVSMPGNEANFTKLNKALWVWRTPLAAISALTTFASRWGFGTIYYSIPPDDRPGLLAGTGMAALSELRKAGISLFMVTGDPRWVRRPHPLPDAITDLIAIQRRTNAFTGLMLDVEPQTLKDWRDMTERPKLAAGFDVLSRSAGEAARSAGLSLGLAIHPAFAHVALAGKPSRSLARAAAETGSELVLMAYRNTPEAIQLQMRSILPDLAEGPARWRLGLTTQEGPDATTISYAGRPKSVFLSDSLAIEAHLRHTAASGPFEGLAIHQYATLPALLES